MSLSTVLNLSNGIILSPPGRINTTESGLTFAAISIGEKGEGAGVDIYFDRPEDIAKLVDALGDLFHRFRAAFADPAARPLKPGESAPGVPPWPVAPGTDTAGWSVSQQLGEQPPPEAAVYDEFSAGIPSGECDTDELPLAVEGAEVMAAATEMLDGMRADDEAAECSACKRAILAGEYMCDECLAKVAS